jgi:hypothetical protein
MAKRVRKGKRTALRANRDQVREIVHREILTPAFQRLFHNPTRAAMSQAADRIAEAVLAGAAAMSQAAAAAPIEEAAAKEPEAPETAEHAE